VSAPDRMVVDLAERLFADHADALGCVSDEPLNAPLWSALVASDLLTLTAPGDLHGLPEACEVAHAKEQISLAALRRDLLTIRSQGYAVSLNRITAGAGVIGMRLPPAASASWPLAVGIGGWSKTIKAKQDELVRLLRAGVERHLGESALSDTVYRAEPAAAPAVASSARRAAWA